MKIESSQGHGQPMKTFLLIEQRVSDEFHPNSNYKSNQEIFSSSSEDVLDNVIITCQRLHEGSHFHASTDHPHDHIIIINDRIISISVDKEKKKKQGSFFFFSYDNDIKVDQE